MSDNHRTPPVTTVAFSDSVNTRSAASSRQTPATAARYPPYAPYTKTPGTRHLRSAKARTKSVSNVRTPPSSKTAKNEDVSKELLNKTWRICRVSPMHQLATNPQRLRHYSRVLSAHLEAENLKNMAVRVENEVANLANFSVFNGLKISDDDRAAIKIDLKQRPKQSNGTPVVVFTAILLCVNGSSDILQNIPREFTLLPVMLMKGPVSLGRSLVKWLERQFDCVIHPVVFSPLVLAWMVSMWAGSAPERSSRPIELQYSVPVEGLTSISLTINAEDCRKLWKCIHGNEDQSFQADEVKRFTGAIENHFKHHFQINLNSMPLVKVGTSIACVGAEGKLKIFSAEHSQQILSHITEFIMEKSLTLSR